MQVVCTVGVTAGSAEVVVAIAIKGATEPLCVSVVDAGRPDGQAHPPIADVGPNKGPGGKDQLQEESHSQQLINPHDLMQQKYRRRN